MVGLSRTWHGGKCITAGGLELVDIGESWNTEYYWGGDSGSRERPCWMGMNVDRTSKKHTVWGSIVGLTFSNLISVKTVWAWKTEELDPGSLFCSPLPESKTLLLYGCIGCQELWTVQQDLLEKSWRNDKSKMVAWEWWAGRYSGGGQKRKREGKSSLEPQKGR